MKIVRPFSLPDGRLLVQLMAIGPGLCSGDSATLDVTVEAGARVVLIAQSATRVLGAPEGEPARQHVTLRVQERGHLEYYPGLIIPFPQSRLEQRVEVDLEPGARAGLAESWAMGRTSRGEYLRFRRLFSHTTVQLNGSPIYLDGIDLEPAAAHLEGRGVLDGHRYVASGFWYGVQAGSLVAPADRAVLMAVGQPAPDQVYLRALAVDGFQLGECVQAVVSAIQAGWRLQPIPLQRFTS
jgi:urease accessory protein